jgi:hypothetical protein
MYFVARRYVKRTSQLLRLEGLVLVVFLYLLLLLLLVVDRVRAGYMRFSVSG